MSNGELNKYQRGKNKRGMERKITKALLNKLLQFPEYERKQLALLLIASTLTDISSKEATELIKEMQK